MSRRAEQPQPSRRLVRPEGLGEQLVAVLRSDILSGKIPPGELLVEAAVAESFAVSRGPARDALRILASEGLITSSGRSFQVIGLDEKDLHDLYTLRELLETAAAKLALETDPEGYCRAAEAALKEMRQAAAGKDIEAFARADVAFHSAFFSHCGNRRLQAVWEQQVPTLTELFRLTTALEPPRGLSRSVEWHSDALESIRGGDPETITAEVHKLVVGGEEQIVAAQRQNSGE